MGGLAEHHVAELVKAISRRTHAASTAIGAVVALLSALIGFVFLVRPNLEPTTTNAVAISNIVVEPEVTLGEYLRHPAVRGSISRSSLAPWLARPDLLRAVGTGIDFQFETKGYAGRALATRWTLFDAGTHRRLGESEDLGPVASPRIETQKREIDNGTWEIWVDTSRFSAASYFARIEVYQAMDGKQFRVTYADSPVFPAPSR